MIRTKKPIDLVKVSNAVIRPNIWLQKDPSDGLERRVFNYGIGGCKVIVSGILYEKDFGAWLCMLELVRQNNNQRWESDQLLLDIARQMGVQNPYQKIPALWETFDRLLDAQIRIRPEKGMGLTAKFSLIEGWLNSDGKKGSFGVSQYKEIVSDLILGQTTISKKMYLGIKGTLSRSLYRFLTSQQPFYSGKGYQIRLSLLCEYLNYDVAERPWWEILPIVLKAIEKLKQAGFIGRYKYEKDRQKSEGGIFTFYPAKKAPKPLTGAKANDEVVQIIQDVFTDQISWSKSTEDKLRNVLNQTKNYLEANNGDSLKGFITDYCEWLKDKKLKYITPSLFSSDNGYFQEYIKKQKENSWDNANPIPNRIRKKYENDFLY